MLPNTEQVLSQWKFISLSWTDVRGGVNTSKPTLADEWQHMVPSSKAAGPTSGWFPLCIITAFFYQFFRRFFSKPGKTAYSICCFHMKKDNGLTDNAINDRLSHSRFCEFAVCCLTDRMSKEPPWGREANAATRRAGAQGPRKNSETVRETFEFLIYCSFF